MEFFLIVRILNARKVNSEIILLNTPSSQLIMTHFYSIGASQFKSYLETGLL